VAELAMDEASRKGHWVILQNIHLVKKWLPLLEKKLEMASEGSSPDYRIFMSAEPASTPAGHIIPQVFSPLLIYHLSFIIYHLSFIIYHLSFIIHHSSFIIYQ
jgi:hypothetical protein